MHVEAIDWAIIIAFFVLTLGIGAAVARRAGASSAEFFAAGRSMPWWLLGVSMVATTFGADTPLLVTQFVRERGVAGNWEWWAFLLSGMLTVFVYARLWQRAGILTDIEFYELRYSGSSASFLRGFRAIYIGVLFNLFIMASVSLAAMKIGSVLLGLTPVETLLIAGTVTVIYSSLGGLRGVVITDCVQFVLAMGGAIGAAVVALQHPDVGGMTGLLAHPALQDKIALLPDFSATNALMAVFIIPLAVQWWATWYPGAEPGGGTFIAQRMLAAKSEDHAVGAALLFNVAHYALRPWPWIIVALASLVVFPDVEAIQDAFPQAHGVAANDMAYPAMLTFLPAGLMGLVLASLIAAYMSTISTLLNLGSSYVVHDFYHRFVRPDCSEKNLVRAGRFCTVALMVLSCILALFMESALANFEIILQIGAGTGLLFILRWFWWRINAWSEIAAMVISFTVAGYFQFVHTRIGMPEMEGWQTLVINVGITTVGWLVTTYLTPPTTDACLTRFYEKIRPGGPGWEAPRHRLGWKPASELGRSWAVPHGILCMFLGCVMIYSLLFATGNWLYGRHLIATLLTLLALAAAGALFHCWKRVASTG